MQNKKRLCHLPRRAVCLTLAGLMILSTALTGCASQSMTAHALENDPQQPVAEQPSTDADGNELANISVTVENKAEIDTVLTEGNHSMIAYDYVVLPLFTPNSVESLYTNEIEVFVNGEKDALGVEDLAYNPAEGTLTINRTAKTITDIKVVLREKKEIKPGDPAEPEDKIETLDKSQSGMIPIYNVDTGKSLMPDINFEKLTVGDVFAYKTVNNSGVAHAGAADKLWEAGASEFVYTTDYEAGTTAENTYLAFVGNEEPDESKMNYTAGKKDEAGFVMELPFPDEGKTVKEPVLVKTRSHKITIGTPFYFGEKEDWKWNSVEDADGMAMNYSIPGQQVVSGIKKSRIAAEDPFAWIQKAAETEVNATIRVMAITEDYAIFGLANLNDDATQLGTALIKVGRFMKVGVNKTAASDLAGATADNACYGDIKDAEYGFYEDAEATKLVETIKANGEDIIGLPRGIYYVKETKAPLGYQMDTEVHEVEIAKDGNLDFADVPISDSSIYAIQKNVENRDKAGKTAGDVGALKDILFDVYYFKGTYDSVEALPSLEEAMEHAVLKTNEEGLLVLDAEHLAEGSWKFVDANGKLTYPLGTILVKEKEAIDGLLISNETGVLLTITDESGKAAIKVISGSSDKALSAEKAAASYENAVAKGGVTVAKADADLNKSDYQGDAALSGAEFTIYNRSEAPVFYKGKLIEKDGEVDVITTAFNEEAGSYIAAIDAKALEYGTYEIKETKAPEGYILPDWSRTFKIREDGQMHFFTQTSEADIADEAGMTVNHQWCVDNVMRGGVTFGKVDRETKGYTSLGAASLAGAKFQIINKSKHAVVVNGTTYDVDAVVMELTAEEMEVNGKKIVGATTGEKVLPYGTYDIVEIGTGTGYLFDSKSKSQVKTFTIRADGEMADFTETEDAFHNQVQREDWYFSKKAADSGKAMTDIAWTVTSVTTGEMHVIVTDENGRYQSNQVKHSQNTNANDAAVAVDENGNYYLADASKLDKDAGTWFAGMKDAKDAAVNDNLRAYPYDTYLVQELSSEANKGYNLVSFLVTLNRFTEDPDGEGILLDYGTVNNQHVDIHTALSYAAGKFDTPVKKVPAAKDVEVTATVTYSGLTADGKYTVNGAVHAIDKDGKDTGVIAENTMELTAKAAGQTKMTFKVDTTELEGYTLAATIDLLQDKTVLAQSTALDDVDASVLVEAAKTPDKPDPENPDKPDPENPGPENPDKPDPENPDKPDPENPDKPAADMIDTYVVNANGFTKEISAAADQTIQTVIKLKDMKEDATYKLEGAAYWIDNGGEARAITDAEGNAIKNVIEKPESTNVMTFKGIDASKLGGHDIVIYHTLYVQDGEEWKVVSEHCDSKDADLTVHVPAITTRLTIKDGKLVDEVSYKNLTKGQKYELNGSLHIREDEKADEGYKAVDKGEVKDSAVTAAFTAAEKDGTAEVTFTADKKDFNGKVIVAFEELYATEENKIPEEWAEFFKDGSAATPSDVTTPSDAAKPEKRLIAEHKDITDAAQTASILNIKAATLTTEDGKHEIAAPGKVKLIGTVEYEGAIPGAVYNITGTINVKGETGDKAVVATVNDVFTPEAVSGKVEMTFNVDVTNLTGKTLVMYETISRNGTTLASRNDADDKNQSVTVAGTPKPSLDTVLVGDKAQATDKNATSVKSVKQQKKTEAIKLTDTVTYKDLTPGKEYTLKGEIHLNNNGTDAGKLATGKAVKFTPKTADGTVEMTFAVSAANAKDGSYVAFEYLYDGETLVASHADIKDKDQTVTVALFGSKTDDTKKDDTKKDTTKKDTTTKTTTKKTEEKLGDKVETVKTGENTFLLASLIGLAVLCGGGYLFLMKTAKGRELFDKIRKMFAKE